MYMRTLKTTTFQSKNPGLAHVFAEGRSCQKPFLLSCFGRTWVLQKAPAHGVHSSLISHYLHLRTWLKSESNVFPLSAMTQATLQMMPAFSRSTVPTACCMQLTAREWPGSSRSSSSCRYPLSRAQSIRIARSRSRDPTCRPLALQVLIYVITVVGKAEAGGQLSALAAAPSEILVLGVAAVFCR